MNGSDLPDQIRMLLPSYLSPEQQRDLWSEIRSFPASKNFYLPADALDHDLLQGDGWRGLVAVDVERLVSKRVVGVLVSNSCDIDVLNQRAIIPKLLFAPILPLKAFVKLYREAGRSEEQLVGFLESVRRQEISNIFYLPDAPYGPGESIVLLDDIHQQHLTRFVESDRTRVFRLNQSAFWLFVIKLSIHFTRFNEDVPRFPEAMAS